MQTTGSLRSSYQYHHHDYGRLHGECHMQPFDEQPTRQEEPANRELLMHQQQQQYLQPLLSATLSGTDHQFSEQHHCYEATGHELEPETTTQLVYNLDRGADVCQPTQYPYSQPETTTATACNEELNQQTYMTFAAVDQQPIGAAAEHQEAASIYYEPAFDLNHHPERQPIIYSETIQQQQQPIIEESATTGHIESSANYFQQQQQHQYLDSQSFVQQQIETSYADPTQQCITSDLMNGHHHHQLAELEKPASSYGYSECYASQLQLQFGTSNNHPSDGNNDTTNQQDEQQPLGGDHARETHSPAVSSISDSSSEESSNSTPTRDEKRAREANLPMSYHEIVNLSIEHFNEQLARHTLTEVQLQLIKDIRRRGKNKVAAQSCRKRKMEQIYELQHEVSGLTNKRLNLERECDQLAREYESLIQHFNRINSVVQRELQQHQQQQQVVLDQTHHLPGTTC